MQFIVAPSNSPQIKKSRKKISTHFFLLAFTVTAFMALSLVMPKIGSAQSVDITEYNISNGGIIGEPERWGEPNDIAPGSDGALWFVQEGGAIGRVDTDGDITSFVVPPSPGSNPALTMRPRSISAGPDGALWFTLGPSNAIGRITVEGNFSFFPLSNVPGSAATSRYPDNIIPGPDGALWFTTRPANSTSDRIGRITIGGQATYFPLQANVQPTDITVGPDGALWITATSSVTRMAIDGSIQNTYPLPIIDEYTTLRQITTGSDGALWITRSRATPIVLPASNAILRLDVNGQLSTFVIPTPESEPYGITSGADGALWFTEGGPSSYNGSVRGGNKIGRIDVNGNLTEYGLPTANSRPMGIAIGSDGNIWATLERFSKIAKLEVSLPYQAPTGLSANSPTKKPLLTWQAAEGAVGYGIYRNGLLAATVGPEITSYTDQGQLGDAAYEYYVTSIYPDSHNEPSESITVIVDNTRPSAVLTSPMNNFTLSTAETLPLLISASDMNNVKRVVVNLYDENNQQLIRTIGSTPPQNILGPEWNGSFALDGSTMQPGNYTLRLGAVDVAGNNRTVHINFTVTQD